MGSTWSSATPRRSHHVGETADRGEVGEAGVGIADVGGEELPEAALGVGGGGEERGRRRAGTGRRDRGGIEGEQVGEHGKDIM